MSMRILMSERNDFYIILVWKPLLPLLSYSTTKDKGFFPHTSYESIPINVCRRYQEYFKNDKSMAVYSWQNEETECSFSYNISSGMAYENDIKYNYML